MLLDMMNDTKKGAREQARNVARSVAQRVLIAYIDERIAQLQKWADDLRAARATLIATAALDTGHDRPMPATFGIADALAAGNTVHIVASDPKPAKPAATPDAPPKAPAQDLAPETGEPRATGKRRKTLLSVSGQPWKQPRDEHGNRLYLADTATTAVMLYRDRHIPLNEIAAHLDAHPKWLHRALLADSRANPEAWAALYGRDPRAIGGKEYADYVKANAKVATRAIRAIKP